MLPTFLSISFFANPNPIIIWSYGLYVVVAFLSGIACGAVGVGGVFLAPTLILISVDPKVAVASALASFFPSSLAQVIIERKKVHFIGAVCLICGALPGSVGGALVLPIIPSSVIAVIVAIVASGSGLNMLRQIYFNDSMTDEVKTPSAGSTDNITELSETNSRTVRKDNDDNRNNNSNNNCDNNNNNGGKKGEDATIPASVMFQFQENLFVKSSERFLLVAIGMFGGFTSIMTASGGLFATLPVLFLFFKDLNPQAAVFLCFAASVIICGSCTVVFLFVATDLDLGIIQFFISKYT
jgi:uncharacterized membrane protein YfcA